MTAASKVNQVTAIALSGIPVGGTAVVTYPDLNDPNVIHTTTIPAGSIGSNAVWSIVLSRVYGSGNFIVCPSPFAQTPADFIAEFAGNLSGVVVPGLNITSTLVDAGGVHVDVNLSVIIQAVA